MSSTSNLPLKQDMWGCHGCGHRWMYAVAICFVCGKAHGKEAPVLELIQVIPPLPTSLSYLHSLAANGMGDCYNWDKSEVTIHVCEVDRRRETGLNSVEKVVITYEKR